MSLQIGTQLGTLEILALLGRGGMGEVYRARDTKLKREVAIKILPDEFSRDPDRVVRFQREAEVLASLNHANIAAIYDLQEANGSRFLVLELVEGETLAERIKRGPIPVDEALSIAKNICEALEAAHEKNIIHRDLKPANVKITPEGKVKVLDFGLAKAFETETSKANLSQSPTLSMAATNAGVILGTAAYMSPEQAKGKTVDRRADIWAFGVVVYEMLTGRTMFSGETVSETMAEVMMKEPDWNALPAATPSRLQGLLRRCLVKEPRNRLRDIGDARIEIKQALNEPDPMAIRTEPKRRKLLTTLAIAAVLFTFLLGIVGGLFLRNVSSDGPEVHFEINTAPRGDNWLAMSPDGQWLVFGGLAEEKRQLWIRPLNSTTVRPLAGTEGAIYPFWSPDSRSLGFFSDGKLKRIELAGGPPQTLTTTSEPRGGAWGKNGTIIFAPFLSGPLYRIPAVGGEPAEATHLETGETAHRFPTFLPDGQHFLYVDTRRDNAPVGVYLDDLEGSPQKRLLNADSMAVYGSPGLLLFRRQQTLLAQRFDLKKLQLAGEAFPIAEGVLSSTNAGSIAVSATQSGAIAYRTGTALRQRLAWFNRAGKEVGGIITLNSSTLRPLAPELSPDGTRVAVYSILNGNIDIWLAEVFRGVTTRFTTHNAVDQFPLWSPDGSRIVFTSARKGNFDLYVASSNGNGVEEILLENPGTTVASSWSSDGRFILYSQLDPKTGFDVWALPLSGARKPLPIANRDFDEMAAEFSTDMRWIAYQSNESGRFEIFVQPFPDPVGKRQVSTGGGITPRWSTDGKELFYVSADGALMMTPVRIAPDGKTIEPGKPVPLITGRIVSTSYNGTDKPHYAVTRDGQRFLLVVPVDEAPPPITVILNQKPPAK